MTESKPDLKPCPFCGSKLEMTKGFYEDSYPFWLHHPLTGLTIDAIYYPKCVLDGYYFINTPKNIEFWNRRFNDEDVLTLFNGWLDSERYNCDNSEHD